MRGSLEHPGDAPAQDSGQVDARSCVVKLAGLSQTGITFECAHHLKAGQEISIDLPCVVSKRAIVVWCDGKRCVCEFVVPLRFQDVRRCFIEYTRITPVD